MENYLSRHTNDLFKHHDKVIQYDLTKTYFEGRMENSIMAKFGRSKEKRSDSKTIVLAVVINTEGFLRHSDIFKVIPLITVPWNISLPNLTVNINIQQISLLL